MAIGFRSSSTGDIHAPGTITITKPTGWAATDVFITGIGSSRGGAGGSGTYSGPTGWTAIATHVGTAAGNDVDIAGWWALGSVASLGFTKSGTVDDAGWVCLALTGVDNTTPIDAVGTPNTNTGANSITMGAVTVVTDQAWLLGLFSDWLDGLVSATGFTRVENAHSNGMAACLYNTTPKSVGTTGTTSVADSASASGQRIAAMPFALRPAGGGGGSVAGSTLDRSSTFDAGITFGGSTFGRTQSQKDYGILVPRRRRFFIPSSPLSLYTPQHRHRSCFGARPVNSREYSKCLI